MSEPRIQDGAEAKDPDLAILLADPQVRLRLAEALQEERESRRPRKLMERLQPFAAGLVSGGVTVLAFFLPSIQDQWDRYQSRRVVSRYVEMGRAFMGDGRYAVAEQAFAKALELSENKRLDVEELRLTARVERIEADATWGAPNPEGLEESDFLYLLQMQQGEQRKAQRSATLSVYGAFLAGARRYAEAERVAREAIALDASAAGPEIHLGNVLADRGDTVGAEAAYRAALRLDPEEPHAHYNLGLLLSEKGRAHDATVEFEAATRLAPEEPDAWERLADCLTAEGRSTEAHAARARALTLRREAARSQGAEQPSAEPKGGVSANKEAGE